MGAQTVTNHFHNGKQNGVGRLGATKSTKFWHKIQINEWTFSVFLFVLSLAIVAGKIAINYGDASQWTSKVQNTSSLSAFSHVYDVFGIKDSQHLSMSSNERLKMSGEKFVNFTLEFGNAIAGAVASVLYRFGWLLKASFFGLGMMGFTWFIIYKDSSIPGVNPPLPFSPSKRQYPEKPRLQLNYLVGVLNGLLIFIYSCL